MLRYVPKCSMDQRKQWDEFFDEVDAQQRQPAGPIPTHIWIPESRADVKKYMDEIGYIKPKAKQIARM